MEGTVVDQVMDIVGWYRDLPPDYLDINELMYSRKQLATLSVTFATEVSAARRAWKKAETRYEVIKNQKRVKFLDKGTTKADWFSRANTEQELEQATEYECLYWDADYILRAVREVLGEMNQRISYLRDEEKTQRFNS